MTPADWDLPFARALGVLLNGDAIPSPDEQGDRVVGDTLLVLMNAHHEDIEFTLPRDNGDDWAVLVDTRAAEVSPDAPALGEPSYSVMGRSLVVMKRIPG
jgi:glycogen operon protein